MGNYPEQDIRNYCSTNLISVEDVLILNECLFFSDHSPEKIHFVKESLVKFSNTHLAKLGYEVTDLETDFADGVRLILLLGSLEGFFIPFYSFHLKPKTVEEKLENVSHSFSLMEEACLPRPRNRPYEIVHKDLKSTLRIIYSLFIKYKN